MSTSRGPGAPTIGWMLGMSTWMISAFIPGSYLSWLGFLIVGIVGRKMRWTVVGVVLGALAIIVHLPIWGQWQPMAAGLLYIAGMLLALMANPGWLRSMWQRRVSGAQAASSSATPSTRATRTEPARATRKEPTRARRREPARARRREPARARRREPTRATQREATEADRLATRAGASSAEFLAPSTPAAAATPEPVDVNTADADVLAGLPGVSARQARRLVKQRTAAGGFTSLDAFATAAGLQPHELVRLRSAAVCSRPPRAPRQFGRRVDY